MRFLFFCCIFICQFIIMLQPDLLHYLKALAKNNNKSWFDNQRSRYDLVRGNFVNEVEQLIHAIGKFDPPVGNLVTKNCVFRINRDVRFSKDKSPYKTNFSAYFNKGGKNSNGAGYYLSIQPGQTMAGGGIWMPMPADLARIRQEIDYNFNDWKKIIGQAGFKKMFPEGVTADQTLTRPPKGYEPGNPAMEFIKMKSFIVSRSFTDKEVTAKSFIPAVAATFKAMKPLVDFINQAVD